MIFENYLTQIRIESNSKYIVGSYISLSELNIFDLPNLYNYFPASLKEGIIHLIS